MTSHFTILHYPGASVAAIEGLKEFFAHTEFLCERDAMPGFGYSVATAETLPDTLPSAAILPPAFGNDHYLSPDPAILDWLIQANKKQCTLASACAGAFYLSAAGALNNRRATTHWSFQSELSRRTPQGEIDTNEILVTDANIITAGGLLSWVDLALELVAATAGLGIMRELGRYFIVDTGRREQRYYRGFHPPLNHTDSPVKMAQSLIERTYASPIRISALAKSVGLSERTFLRRFEHATALTPLAYVQHLRVQSAQRALENTAAPIEQIAYAVGYENAGAFRKLFKRHTGLSPSQYRQRLRR